MQPTSNRNRRNRNVAFSGVCYTESKLLNVIVAETVESVVVRVNRTEWKATVYFRGVNGTGNTVIDVKYGDYAEMRIFAHRAVRELQYS